MPLWTFFCPSPLFVLFVHPLHLPDQAQLHILHVLARLPGLKIPSIIPPKGSPNHHQIPRENVKNPIHPKPPNHHHPSAPRDPPWGDPEHGGEDPEVFD